MAKPKPAPLNVQGYCCDYSFFLANKSRNLEETEQLYKVPVAKLVQGYLLLSKNRLNCESKLGICVIGSWKQQNSQTKPKE